MKCQFCNKNEGTESIIDSETLQEVMICVGCDTSLKWEGETPKGYTELTIQELEKGIDKIVDNQIEDLKLQRLGIEE